MLASSLIECPLFVNIESIVRIASCARQKDMNVRPWQENLKCECLACSQQKGVNDKTPRIKKKIISIVNKLAGYDI